MELIQTFEMPLKFYGLQVGCRMTVVNINGDLLLHSPIDIEPQKIEVLGVPRWVLAPNRLHHLFVGPWMERGLEGWAAPGLPERRPDLQFDYVVDQTMSPFGDAILLIPLKCFPLINEVVMLHRPSRTLVVTDFVFNFSEKTTGLTRAALRAVGAFPGCKVSLLERLALKRAVAREEISALLDLDFDRIILSHGDIVQTGGKDALRSAYRWLGF